MKQEFLLEVMKHDELVSEIKKSMLNQIARDNARKKLRAKRTKIREQQESYEKRTRGAIFKIDQEICKLDDEESELCVITDNYGDTYEEAPYFTREAIELLIDFMKEYRKNGEE